MPFLNLDNAWSNLAPYYNSVTNSGVFASTVGNSNVTYTQKPNLPKTKYTNFDDGLIRGGIINVGIAASRDFDRIGNFLKSGKGLLWIAKQTGLQLSNPRLEQPSPGTEGYDDRFTNNTRVYNLGLNTLTQVPLNALGGHIIRHGLLPKSGVGFLKGDSYNIYGYKYEQIVKQNDLKSRQNSTSPAYNYSSPTTSTTYISPASPPRVVGVGTGLNNSIPTTDIPVFLPGLGSNIFYDAQGNPTVNNLGNVAVPTTPKQISTLSYSNSPNRLLTYLKAINTNPTLGDIPIRNNEGEEIETKKEKVISSLINTPITLQSYWGGANSVYGIGTTFIKTSPDQRTNTSDNTSDPKRNLFNGFKPKPYFTIDTISTNISSDRNNKTYIYPLVNSSTVSSDANLYNIENYLGVSRIGANNPNRTIDSINVIDITTSSGSAGFYANLTKASSEVISNYKVRNSDNSESNLVGGVYGKDIIKFRIEFLNNDTQQTSAALSDVNTDVLAFRAYIDDFTDGMQAKWNSYKYMGRGEDFYIYEGFTRDISVAFTIYTHSPEEMKPIYKKLNYLMSTFTPDYNSANRMRGNIAYLTVGDYIYRQPGVFTDIKLSGMLDTHWEIGLDKYKSGDKEYNYLELPKHIKVALSFKPIHTFLPRKVNASSKPTFITPDPAYKTPNNYIN
jgi:hypothetical protein